MFFYLLHNSTLIKKQKGIDKHISTMIYGSLIYILLHALLYASIDNKFFISLRKYFWIIFVLDCISVSFTYIVNENGKILFDRTLNFPETPKLNQHPKNNIIPNNEIAKKKLSDSKPAIESEVIPEKKSVENKKKPDIVKNKPDVNLKKGTSILDLRKEEIERIALNNVDKDNSDGDSEMGSELGSDLDLDAFEKSLNNEYSLK